MPGIQFLMPELGTGRRPMKGLTPFAHAAKPSAVVDAVRFVTENADMPAYHENPDDSPAVLNFIAREFAASGKPVYLAVQMIEGRDHLDQIDKLVRLFQPDFLNFAIEANLLSPQLRSQIPEIYSQLKATYTFPVFMSFQTTFNWEAKEIIDLAQHSDYLGISTYPYATLGTQLDYTMRAAMGNKPIVITETAWPAEPYNFDFHMRSLPRPGSEESQVGYLQFLRSLAVEFFVWFVPRDYDDLWTNFLEPAGSDRIALLWKNTGLLDGSGAARPSLLTWNAT